VQIHPPLLNTTKVDFTIQHKDKVAQYISFIDIMINRTQLLNQLPYFEPSYEVKQHKMIQKEHTSQEKMTIWMPTGWRCYLWVTVDPNTGEDSIFQISNDRSKIDKLPKEKLQQATVVEKTVVEKTVVEKTVVESNHPSISPTFLFYGTVFSAFLCNNHYVVTDLYWFRGVPMKSISQKVIWSCIASYICPHFNRIVLPKFVLHYGFSNQYDILKTLPDPAYHVHHIQERYWTVNKPYQNYPYTAPKIVTEGLRCGVDTASSAKMTESVDKKAEKEAEEKIQEKAENEENQEKAENEENQEKAEKTNQEKAEKTNQQPPVRKATEGVVYRERRDMKKEINKPQYGMETVFAMMADPTYDLYRLYVVGAGGLLEFYDYACIIDRATSKWLNSEFRLIRENANIDAIEESDDEADFNDVRDNKYTNLEKQMVVRCRYIKRLKKWIPVVGSSSLLKNVVHKHRL